MADHVERHLVAELLHEMRNFRPRANDAHVAFEHVDELGQFVDGELADQRAEERAAVVFVG